MHFENIPRDLAIALGAHPDEVPAAGLDPQELLAELMGSGLGSQVWLDVLGRMSELARAQATEAEIVASLAAGPALGADLSPELARAIVAASAAALDLARQAGLADLRERLWKAGLTGGSKGEAAIISLARQYLGWDTVDGLDPKILREAIRAARSAKR